MSIIKSSKVCAPAPYFLGIAVGESQIRIGLIWWHVIILTN